MFRYHRGERWGWATSDYDVGMDENTWSLKIGWGGRLPQPPPGEYHHPYRFAIEVQWRPLATCFEWWAEYLGVEYQWHHRKGVHTRILCGVAKQYRIHSFRRWPVAVRFFRSKGRNAE